MTPGGQHIAIVDGWSGTQWIPPFTLARRNGTFQL
jgi:hypothetical protein